MTSPIRPTRPTLFPFAALVGLDTLKLALQLAAIDLRLSVLVRGDKGAGKSTAARGLAALLAPGAPFVTLPIGATEDRLLGGLDIARALTGEPALKPGVLAEAHGGVLYIDEVNLLPDHLADALLDAVASGVHVLEREGFSVTQATDFVLIGSMNPEEGALRPQLLDRFALAVDVEAPLDPRVRSEVLERRLAFDTDPVDFAAQWASDNDLSRETLAAARARLADTALPRAMLQQIATRVAGCGVRSLRADLAVMRACRAYAALEGAAAVSDEHVERVLPLALAHRAAGSSPPSSPPRGQREAGSDADRSNAESRRDAAPSNAEGRDHTDAGRDNADVGDSDRAGGRAGDGAAAERIFAAANVAAMPRLTIEHATPGQSASPSAGRSTNRASTVASAARGPIIGARRTPDPREIDVRSSLIHAVTRAGGAAMLQADDLHEKTRAPRVDTRYIVIVDSSGSHAVHERMRLVKGAISGLLGTSHGRHDEIVVVTCRGAAAAVLVEPTTSRLDVERALEYLPTGGRTPLAHALELAATYVTDRSMVLLVTDGHANVPHRSDDAWSDALTSARGITCPAIVIDSEDDRQRTGRPQALAEAMRATYARIGDLDHTAVLRIIREGS